MGRAVVPQLKEGRESDGRARGGEGGAGYPSGRLGWHSGGAELDDEVKDGNGVAPEALSAALATGFADA